MYQNRAVFLNSYYFLIPYYSFLKFRYTYSSTLYFLKCVLWWIPTFHFPRILIAQVDIHTCLTNFSPDWKLFSFLWIVSWNEFEKFIFSVFSQKIWSSQMKIIIFIYAFLLSFFEKPIFLYILRKFVKFDNVTFLYPLAAYISVHLLRFAGNTTAGICQLIRKSVLSWNL
jgi:hypothetical protein